MHLKISHAKPDDNKGKVVIRLDFIILFLEALKLQGYCDIQWSTILMLWLIPLAIAKLIKLAIYRWMKKNGIPIPKKIGVIPATPWERK